MSPQKGNFRDIKALSDYTDRRELYRCEVLAQWLIEAYNFISRVGQTRAPQL